MEWYDFEEDAHLTLPPFGEEVLVRWGNKVHWHKGELIDFGDHIAFLDFANYEYRKLDELICYEFKPVNYDELKAMHIKRKTICAAKAKFIIKNGSAFDENASLISAVIEHLYDIDFLKLPENK